jgi:hypothetical protein
VALSRPNLCMPWKDTKHRRAKLTRAAHELARSGKYEDADAVIEAIRSHEDFHPDSHETGTFRAALDAICRTVRTRSRSG